MNPDLADFLNHVGICLYSSLLAMLLVVLWGFACQILEDAARRDINTARQIIRFKQPNNASSIEERLRLRSTPSKSLVEAFHIQNSFTTNDTLIHRKFISLAKSAISKEKFTVEKWTVVLNQATQDLQGLCWTTERKDGERGVIKLAEMVRVLCLMTALRILFDATLTEADVPALLEISSNINVLKLHSKHGFDATTESKKESLHRALKSLLPEHEADPGPKNLLNLIIPAYETLWRVVLSTFVSITRSSEYKEISQVMKGVARGIIGADCELEDDVLAVAKEGLRLYPSPRSIYRAVGLQEGAASVKADVEALHRKRWIWGADFDKFNPKRFEVLTKDQKLAYMPFGLPMHRCPAAPDREHFGERIIAVLVSILLLELQDFRIRFNDGHDDDLDAALPTGRDEMEAWILVKK